MMSNPDKPSRNKTIDVARGICILLMIFGHSCAWWGGRYAIFNRYYSLFFLVFFFFVSGLFYKELPCFKNQVKKVFIKLEFPYIIVAILSLALCGNLHRPFAIVNSLIYSLPVSLEPQNLILREQTFGIGPIWFLNCLFFSTIIYSLVHNLNKAERLLVCILLAYLSSLTQRSFTLPFNIQNACIGALYMCFGNVLKSFLSKIKNNTGLLMAGIIPLLMCIYVFALNVLPFQYFDLGQNIFYFPSVISSFLGISLLLCASSFLQYIPLLSDILSLFGRSTFFVLIIHSLDIMGLRNWGNMSWKFIMLTYAGYFILTLAYEYVIKMSKRLKKPTSKIS